MKRGIACLALAGYAFAVTACSGPNFEAETATSVRASETLPAPSIADIYGQSRVSRIGPGDKLEISVLDVPALSRTLTVDGRGQIDYPLLGDVDTLALTPSELADRLEARLGERYLQNPQVSVNLAESVSQRITIIGGVNQAGQYPALGNTSLTDAVSLARGLSDDARTDEVVVFRTVEGERLAARFDMGAITGGRAEDPQIYPGDRIVVGSDKTRALLREAAALTPVLGIFYQIF